MQRLYRSSYECRQNDHMKRYNIAMETKLPISVIILAKNESVRIAKSISSAPFADEIVVVNDNSTDNTVQIAKGAGATVITHQSNNNLAAQRTWAMEQARNSWILFLDADEEVSSELVESMKGSFTNGQPKHKNYRLKRRDWFWGSWVTRGEVRKAYQTGIIRFMQKGSGEWKGNVHEVFIPEDTPGVLSGYINHYPHQTVKEFLEHINLYSSIRAQELYNRGVTTNWVQFFTYPFGKFILTYFMYRGFQDGPAGFAYSFFMSFHSFLVRAKLYQLQRSELKV